MIKTKVRIDPYFQEVPWDIIRDDKGRVIGEVYMLWWPAKKKRKKNKGKAV